VVLLYDLSIKIINKNMDNKTKINTVISIMLVALITGLVYWVQMPAKDLKAELLDTDTVLVRIQDFAFDPDVVRIEPETTVSWLHDESEGNADVQHTVSSYDPADTSAQGKAFASSLMSLGDTFSFTFNEPGVYNYNCSLYPFMTGKICVGKESEALDSDCIVDAVATDTVDTTETTVPVVDETLPEDEVAPVVEDTETPVVTAPVKDTETPVVTAPVKDKELSPAADEDFDIVDYSGTKNVVSQQGKVPTKTTAKDDTKLASSGPGEAVYLLVAIFALFMGSRLARNQA
jgi:plastocyanin